MKRLCIFLFFALFALAASAQKYALIDKKLKTPIIYTDSVTVEQIKQGFFPVKNESIDTLVANIEYIKSMLNERQRAKAAKFELQAAATTFEISRVPYAYGDRYDVNAKTNIGDVQAVYTLVKNKNKNKDSAGDLNKLLAYLKNNAAFFKSPNQISPKLYNVVVVTD